MEQDLSDDLTVAWTNHTYNISFAICCDAVLAPFLMDWSV